MARKSNAKDTTIDVTPAPAPAVPAPAVPPAAPPTMNTELVPVFDPLLRGDLAVVRKPEEILREAQSAAKALQNVIEGKKKKLIFNGETYLECGDWILVGRFYGVTPKVEHVEPVEIFGARGFKSSAVAQDANGRILSRAEALCLNDEPKWSTRPKYEWQYVTRDGTLSTEDPGRDNIIWEDNPNRPGKRPKKTRTYLGEEPVPIFQLSSMAQTRAQSKVLANLFRWLATLAGYKGTPAEEMPIDHEEDDDRERPSHQERPPASTAKPTERPPQRPPQTPPPSSAPATPTPDGGERMQENQRKTIFAVGRRHGHDDNAILKWIKDSYKLESSKHLPMVHVNDVIKRMEDRTPLYVDGKPHPGGQPELAPPPSSATEPTYEPVK